MSWARQGFVAFAAVLMLSKPLAAADPGNETANTEMPDGSLAVQTRPPDVFGPGLHWSRVSFNGWISDYKIQVRDGQGKVLVEAPGYAEDDFKKVWRVEYFVTPGPFIQGKTYDVYQYGHDGAGYELLPLKKGQTVVSADQRKLSDADGDWGYESSFIFDASHPNTNVSMLPVSLTSETVAAWRRQNTLALDPTPELLRDFLYRVEKGQTPEEKDEARAWLHLHWASAEAGVKAAIDAGGSRELVDLYHAEGGKAEWFLPEGCGNVNSPICQACAALAMLAGQKPGSAKAARAHLLASAEPQGMYSEEAIVIKPECLDNLKVALGRDPLLASKVVDWILLNAEPDPGADEEGKASYRDWLDRYVPLANSPNAAAAKLVRERLLRQRWLLDVPDDDPLFTDRSQRPLLQALIRDLGLAARYKVDWLTNEWLHAKEPADQKFAEEILTQVEPGVIRAHARQACCNEAGQEPAGAWLKDIYRRPGQMGVELIVDFPALAAAAAAPEMVVSGTGHDGLSLVSARKHYYAQSVSLPVELPVGDTGAVQVRLELAAGAPSPVKAWEAVALDLSGTPKGDLTLSLSLSPTGKAWQRYRIPVSFFGDAMLVQAKKDGQVKDLRWETRLGGLCAPSDSLVLVGSVYNWGQGQTFFVDADSPSVELLHLDEAYHAGVLKEERRQGLSLLSVPEGQWVVLTDCAKPPRQRCHIVFKLSRREGRAATNDECLRLEGDRVFLYTHNSVHQSRDWDWRPRHFSGPLKPYYSVDELIWNPDRSALVAGVPKSLSEEERAELERLVPKNKADLEFRRWLDQDYRDVLLKN